MVVNCLNDAHGQDFAAYHGDCVDVLRQLPDACIDHCVYSPPFGDLFVYSDSAADMGNSSSDREFFEHYGYMLAQLRRVMKPGRVVAAHCSDLPTRKWKDGFIGLRPFSDDLRAAHEAADFIFYRRVTIWKCPVSEQARTHSRNLLYGELRKDSSMSAPGLPDYLMIFRVPGENETPITHTIDDFPLEQWQEWASPVWQSVQQTAVLGGVAEARRAKHEADERHICPLQLDVIRRAVILWSNPGETILSPFMGIGSEGYVSLKERRRFIGVELKESYWQQAVKNLAGVEAAPRLFL